MTDIIIKHRNDMDRAIRDATVQMIEHDRAVQKPRAMPKFNREEGLYEIDEPVKVKHLSPDAIRQVALSYGLHGVKIRVEITDESLVAHITRGRGKDRFSVGSNAKLTEAQVRIHMNAACRNVQKSQ